MKKQKNNRRNKKNKDSAAPLGNFLLNLSFNLSLGFSSLIYLSTYHWVFFLLNLSFLSFNPFFSYLFNFSAIYLIFRLKKMVGFLKFLAKKFFNLSLGIFPSLISFY